MQFVHLVGNGLCAVPPSPRYLHGTTKGILSVQTMSHSTRYSGPSGCGRYADGTARRPFPTTCSHKKRLSKCAKPSPGTAHASRMTHQPGAPLSAGTARQITIFLGVWNAAITAPAAPASGGYNPGPAAGWLLPLPCGAGAPFRRSGRSPSFRPQNRSCSRPPG